MKPGSDKMCCLLGFVAVVTKARARGIFFLPFLLQLSRVDAVTRPKGGIGQPHCLEIPLNGYKSRGVDFRRKQSSPV